METVCRSIFRAIHEEKWLSIEYRNGQEEVTRYWIGIVSIHPEKRYMHVEGLHLMQYTTKKLVVYIDAILSAEVIDGSYFRTDRGLTEDIGRNPQKYRSVFGNVANLKVLNYLADCNKLDATPYKTDYALIQQLDRDWNGRYSLISRISPAMRSR